MRTTDPIHRDIEDYLLAKGLYYDRRKNYHKNQFRPISKIISIPYLAQIVMGTLQQKPDYARARPSTIIKKNPDYDEIFNSTIPIELYYKLVFIQQSVELALKNYNNSKLKRPQIGDIKFHVTMYVVGKLTNKIKPKAIDIANIDLETLTEDIKIEAIDNTFIVYDSMGGTNGVAKGKEFVQEVIGQLKENLKK